MLHKVWTSTTLFAQREQPYFLNEVFKQKHEGKAFQSVHIDLHWSEYLTVCLIKSTSMFLRVFCLLKMNKYLLCA